MTQIREDKNMVNLFKKDGVYIATIIPSTEEERKLLTNIESIMDRNIALQEESIVKELKEKESNNLSDSQEECLNDTKEPQENLNKDSDFEQLLLDLM